MSESPFLKDLLSEQQKAVTHGDGPLLIVAGAGTGKTSVITRRLAWLICEKKIKPDEILALTFTDKAAGEMEERVDRLLPYGYVDLWISTFHSFGERLLRQHGLDIGLPDNFRLLNETEGWLLVRQNLEKFNLDYYRPLGNPAKFIHALTKHFSRCKDELIAPADYLSYTEGLRLNTDSTNVILRPRSSNGKATEESKILRSAQDDSLNEITRLDEVANAYHVYNQLLLDNEALDFGDLINYTLKLFKERPKILEAYRQKFKYILVDEFQDTNLAQYELIKMLAAPKNNLTVVGDDDQSIYKFRGASVSNILHFKTDYPQAELITLTKNFRSEQSILDLSYKLIKNNDPDRLETKLKIDKKLVAHKTGQGIVEKLTAATGEQEAELVVKKIMELKTPENMWSDFAILTRANSHAPVFVQTLERAGIPHQFLASSGLYRQPIVLDILAYLRLLDNYHENTAMYRVLNMPIFGLESSELIKITHQAKKHSWSLYETARGAAALGLKDEARRAVDNLLNLVAKHTALAREKSAREVVLAFLNDSGYLKHLIEKEENGEAEARRQISYLNTFFKFVVKFEGNHEEKLVKDFLAEFDYVLESGDEGAMSQNWEELGPEDVKIMTVHGAKGLEFKYVFLANLVEQRFPTISHAEQIELPEALVKEILPEGDIHIQEERRLFYVAMTRAKTGLFLCRADNYGGVRKKKPSRFLFEVGMEKEEGVKKKPRGAKEELTEENRPPIKTVVNDAVPTHFSFTQLKAFETCPYQYKFAHILKIPTKGNASFSFGKTMHSALQKFFEKVQELNAVQQADLFSTPQKKVTAGIQIPSLEYLLELYEAAWIDEWYQNKKQKEEYFEKGKKILKDFYERGKGEWAVPKFLETGFHIKIGECLLRGQIDRVDPLPDGTVELIDYKTGKPKTAEDLKLADKEQLFIYQMAAEETLREKVSRLSFYYLEDNTKVTFLGAEPDLQKIKKKIVDEIREIAVSDFPANPSAYSCPHCDFRDICEFAER